MHTSNSQSSTNVLKNHQKTVKLKT